MDDLASSWQNPSQSFGYTSSQPAAAPKNPFASSVNAPSSATSAAYRLRWHNSVAEDFSPIDTNGSFSHKRSSSIAMPETNVYPDHFAAQPEQRSSAIPSPVRANNPQTKKRKSSAATSSIASSPAKPKQANDGNGTLSFSHATQAPVKRRRGRPPKNPQPTAGVSQIEFVNEHVPTAAMLPSDASLHRPPSSPALQHLDTFVAYPNPVLSGSVMEPLGEADFPASKFWDASFAGSMVADNDHMTSNFAAMAGEIDFAAATATFDWSVLPTSIGMSAPQDVMDPLRPLSMHNPLGGSFFHDPTQPDALNFSFAADPMSASDIISPISVNPNLIFGGEQFGQSFADGQEPFRPYHQQNLQQQQEQLDEQRKRHRKAASVEAQAQKALKTTPAMSAAASKPIMRRALTESALTKSATKYKASNMTVHPSPVKQMSSIPSGKTKYASARDENTTPSPSIDAISVRQVSPRERSAAKHKGGRRVRTSVNFSISPGGRAKAERIIIRDPDSHSEGSGSDEDQGEYDTDSSTDEDDLGPLSSYSMAAKRLAGPKSRRHGSSSSLNRSMERPKLTRFKTAAADPFSSSQYLVSGDFTSDSFGFDNNPFLPPSLSMSTAISKSPRKGSRRDRGSRRHNRSFCSAKSSIAVSRANNLGSMREDDEYSEAETVIDEPEPVHASQGDAILALKEAVARRNSFCAPGATSKRPPSSSYGTSRPSTRHTNALPSSPPMQQAPYGFSTPQTVRSGYSSDTFNISPTTVTDPDCVTPTTFSRKQSAGAGAGHDIAMDIRCRCSSAGSPEMPVLQCNACFKWVHVQCEGYGHKAIPPSVVCSFCKGGWQGPQQASQRVFRKPSLPQNISPLDARGFQG